MFVKSSDQGSVISLISFDYAHNNKIIICILNTTKHFNNKLIVYPLVYLWKLNINFNLTVNVCFH